MAVETASGDGDFYLSAKTKAALRALKDLDDATRNQMSWYEVVEVMLTIIDIAVTEVNPEAALVWKTL